jgi:hypothetical protein
MMYQMIEFEVKGVSPLMMHNGQLVDPRNQYAAALKPLTGKRKKTEEDLQKIEDLEFEGGLYLDEKGHPCIPGEIIEATLIRAAKKSRQGLAAGTGLLCDGNWPLEYEGPRTFKALAADYNFRDRRRVTVNQSGIMRCRPIFRAWSLRFVVHYLPDTLNETDVITFVTVAGRAIGFLEHRPKYGRFEIVKWTPLKDAKAA